MTPDASAGRAEGPASRGPSGLAALRPGADALRMPPVSAAGLGSRFSLLSTARALIEGGQEPLGGVPVSVLEPAFQHYVSELRVRLGRLMMGWAIVMDLIWWPTDFVLVAPFPHVLEAF